MTCYVAPTAVLAGTIELGDDVSVWHHAVLRADTDAIFVGNESNIQDGVVVHEDEGMPTRIGNRVTVGHRAIIHGCTIGDECVIGMGAIVTSGASIGDHSFIGAGAVVPEGMNVPPRSVVLGVPGKVAKLVSPSHVARMKQSWKTYVELAKRDLPAWSPAAGSAKGEAKRR